MGLDWALFWALAWALLVSRHLASFAWSTWYATSISSVSIKLCFVELKFKKSSPPVVRIKSPSQYGLAKHRQLMVDSFNKQKGYQ